MRLNNYIMIFLLLPFLAACETSEQPAPPKAQPEQEIVLNQGASAPASEIAQTVTKQDSLKQISSEQAGVEKSVAVSKPVTKPPVELHIATKSALVNTGTEEISEQAVVQKKEELSKAVNQSASEPVINNSGDAMKGKVVAKKCATCHTFNQGGKNKVGPNLFGVVGRKQGQVSGFKYGSYLASSNQVWGDENLRAWIYDSKAVAKAKGAKSKMSSQKIKGVKADDLMAYLRTLK